MKKALFFVLLLSCCSLLVSAQDCGNDFLGTKTLYKAPVQKHTPAPAGYLPVFINHVGRHGARHLTKDVNTSLAYALLLKADSLRALTANGRKLKQMMLALQKAEKGGTKFISDEGKNELEGIGEREYANYSNVFNSNPALNVRITKELRTKQSADAFLVGLNKKLKTPLLPEDQVDDIHLRFFDLSPAYQKFEDNVDESGGLKSTYGKALGVPEINKAICAKFFDAAFFKEINDRQQEKFVADVFGFATIVYSLATEVKQAGLKPEDVDFKSFFTCGQLQALAETDSVDDYLKKGPGTDNNGIQVLVAVPLLVDFIKAADEFIKEGKYNAQLRFAHAETISPFAGLLQISGADKASTDMKQVSKIWQAAKVIPLSSNIQWVFYKKKGSTDYLVKVLLNEKEAPITGLGSKQFPYYNWLSLRAFYMKKLNSLHVGLGDDMNAFLLNLK